MKVKWFPEAKVSLRQTARYIRDQFGDKSSKEFLRDVFQKEKLLRDNPHLGPIEPLLADLPSAYRSIVVDRLNKIVYRIVDDYIEIADFWDVRREPQMLTKQLK